MIFEPRLRGTCQIHNLPAEMNPRQAARTFEVLDDVSVISGIADFRDAERAAQFLFRHNAGTRNKFSIWTSQDGRKSNVCLRAVHGYSLSVFSPPTDQDR
jgi:hypothetical protein